ncbi:flagellar biosynthesis protein FlhB [Lacrimispora saccharolytica]|uniref:flagellar biosynthesis protein FlhB n=1 Tax=Lacrimispora saccharolytica TaxID=84030 RepID=UPI00265CC3FB|nr:flagellar biosynthesis protein FlhB [Lacrimispora saccharolytica]MCF2655816.1 flagellar biosynthesis protein FlhB [Lacrimispora saccharolytica]
MCYIFDYRYDAVDIQHNIQRDEGTYYYLCRRNDLEKLPLNLQFFAKDGPGGEKTEEPTAKKLEDARKEGQVAKSKEIANGLGLLALFLLLKIMVGSIGTSFLESFSMVYNRIPVICKLNGGTSPMGDISVLLRTVMLRLLIILLPVLLIGFAVAFVSDLFQVKWRPTSKPLQPKFSKLNPLNGIKKIFSAQSLVELVKSVAKILLIAFVTYSYIKKKSGLLYALYDMSMMQAVNLIGETVIELGIRISAIYMIIAGADFMYQKYKFKNDMKMTKQEVKEEYKNAEGDPEIKGKIKARMREASQRRMMQAIPKADVVITNPTHYAVAIRYDTEVAPAPIVVAKGSDYLAQKIKQIARENNVEIVEDKPLARMLFANVDVDKQIPPELYQAVAEILAMVYHAQGKV